MMNTGQNALKSILAELSFLDLAGCIIEKKPNASNFGGYADVYTARSTKHNRTVAVKQVRIHLQKDVSFAKKLANEVLIWAELNHQYVLPLLGFLVEGEEVLPSLISEWMERGTVDVYMQEFPRGGEDTWSMVSRISTGLVYLHSKGVVHADLKCENILISKDGDPLLADFGISLALARTYTATFNPKGTARWMARELLTGPEDEVTKHTKMSDIWAFGMILYELLSGQVPYFRKKTDVNVSLAITRGELPDRPPLDEALSHLSDVLWGICRRSWEQVPGNRPTAGDVEYVLTSRSEFFSRQFV